VESALASPYNGESAYSRWFNRSTGSLPGMGEAGGGSPRSSSPNWARHDFDYNDDGVVDNEECETEPPALPLLTPFCALPSPSPSSLSLSRLLPCTQLVTREFCGRSRYVAGKDFGVKATGHRKLNPETFGAGEMEEWDEDEEWTPRRVFEAMEADQQRRELLLPQHVPGICHMVAEYAVSPHEPWRLHWNVLVLGVVVYSCIQVPYMAAVEPFSQATLLDYLVDLVFVRRPAPRSPTFVQSNCAC
jgi:hypothetical protein